MKLLLQFTRQRKEVDFHLTLFVMGLTGATHRCSDQKPLLLYNVKLTSQNNEIWHRQFLHKEDPKNIPNSLHIFKFQKVYLINMITILIISTKLAAPGCYQINLVRSQSLLIALPAKTVPHDSNYTLYMLLWLRFGNSSISLTKIVRIWPKYCQSFLSCSFPSSSMILNQDYRLP